MKSVKTLLIVLDVSPESYTWVFYKTNLSMTPNSLIQKLLLNVNNKWNTVLEDLTPSLTILSLFNGLVNLWLSVLCI